MFWESRLYVSFRNLRLFFLYPIVSLLLTSVTFSQEIKIIQSRDQIAVINQGSTGGIQEGELFAVKRFVNDIFEEITYVEVTHIRNNIARIQVMSEAPQEDLQIGDVVEKLDAGSVADRIGRHSVTENSVFSASSVSTTKFIYLGPTIGGFIPLGDMKDIFESHIVYGGILGVRFRENLDVSIRFFYTAKKNDWSLWDVQLLGRRYIGNHFLMDFGYGICYSEGSGNSNGSSGGGEPIHLGFIGGMGLILPIAFKTHFEIGLLFHYYPNFGDRHGQFLTIQGRLVL